MSLREMRFLTAFVRKDITENSQCSIFQFRSGRACSTAICRVSCHRQIRLRRKLCHYYYFPWFVEQRGSDTQLCSIIYLCCSRPIHWTFLSPYALRLFESQGDWKRALRAGKEPLAGRDPRTFDKVRDGIFCC